MCKNQECFKFHNIFRALRTSVALKLNFFQFFAVYQLTDCAVTTLAPTNDVSRHIGSPHAKHTPKTPSRTSARPPISLP